MTQSKISDDQIRAWGEIADAATPGPWEWYGNTKMKEVYLATVHGGRVFVMDFVRWGMAGAQPRFQVRYERNLGVMEALAVLKGQSAPKMLGSHRKEFVGIGHPDATFIAAAREAVPALVWEVKDLRDRLRVSEEQNDALGDANVLSVENDRLRVALREACSLAERAHEIIAAEGLDDHGEGPAARRRVAELRGMAGEP